MKLITERASAGTKVLHEIPAQIYEGYIHWGLNE